MIDRVGVLSWDITKVAFFSGFRACATSSAAVMSASVRVHRSFSYFRTSGASSAAETAGCCSKNLSSMPKALFQRVGTSVTSLCCGRTSNFCLFLSAWLAKVLWWKKVEMRLTLPRSRVTAGILRAACEAKLSMWAKQPTCNDSMRRTASSMLAALSVTIASTLSVNPHSFIVSVNKFAILLPVWLLCRALVCRTFDTDAHSLEKKWEVIVT